MNDTQAALDNGPSHTEPAPYDYLKDDCRIWDGPQDPKGYGRIDVPTRGTRVHRAAWTAAHGPVPEGLLVLHRCDRNTCIEPRHLWTGTHTQHHADLTARGVTPEWLTRRVERNHRRHTERTAASPRTHCRNGHPLTSAAGCVHGRACGTAARILTARDTTTAAMRDWVLNAWDTGHEPTRTEMHTKFGATGGYTTRFHTKMTRARAAIEALRGEPPSHSPRNTQPNQPQKEQKQW